MRPTLPLANHDVRHLMRALSADMKAALALNRVALQAAAALSPAFRAAARDALESEMLQARGAARSSRAAERIEAAQAALAEAADDQDPRLAALERALIAAADALPTFDLDAAEAAVSARGG